MAQGADESIERRHHELHSKRYRSAIGVVGFVVASSLATVACVRPTPRPEPPLPSPTATPAPPPLVAPPDCVHIERIVVHKGERRLWAHCRGGARVTFAVALGRGLPGAKQRQGDQRTPEGDYRLVGHVKRSSRFHRFAAIDYPSRVDADRALAEGRISRTDHARILDAHRRGIQPPVDTPLGGDIGFHGEGERWRGESVGLDWTYGCIALPDADLDFVLARAPPGTPVSILSPSAPLPPELVEP